VVQLSINDIVSATSGKLISGSRDASITGISTDSRTIEPGNLFFALDLGSADGHNFIKSAVENGASGVVVSRDLDAVPECPIIKVSDTLWALGDLAAYYRSRFDAKVIAVTGSVGKTSTKEMLASILSQKFNVLKSALNHNNEIGVPQTLFQMDQSHEVVVVEMAMRGLGEIRRLAQIARPQIGVITNIGMSHIERLGSQGAIADAKSELLSELPLDGVAVLNGEDGYYPVLESRFPGRIISFGACSGVDVAGARIKYNKDGQCRFALMIDGEGAIELTLPIPGTHNVYNALAAGAAAYALGMDLYAIKDGLESFDLPSMRMNLDKTVEGIALLNDAYNANPASMAAAIKTLRALSGWTRKVAVLGDMLELGEFSERAHLDLGRSVMEAKIDLLITVGDGGKIIARGANKEGMAMDRIRSYENSVEAAEAIHDWLEQGDAVLVKGSRGMKMEQIAEALHAG
jgi:UDP-N-acetylmuramoyl-tripeptide--D-alanyl-D-alanine ligase